MFLQTKFVKCNKKFFTKTVLLFLQTFFYIKLFSIVLLKKIASKMVCKNYFFGVFHILQKNLNKIIAQVQHSTKSEIQNRKKNCSQKPWESLSENLAEHKKVLIQQCETIHFCILFRTKLIKQNFKCLQSFQITLLFVFRRKRCFRNICILICEDSQLLEIHM